MAATTTGRKQTYKEAMDELQQILLRLRKSADQVDVDDLLADVQRAKELIHFCDAKIKNADMQIQDVLKQINPQTVATEPPEPEPNNGLDPRDESGPDFSDEEESDYSPPPPPYPRRPK